MRLITGLLFLGSVSFAQAETQPKYDPKPDVERIVRSVEDGGLAEEMQIAIESLLTKGADEMKVRGHVAEADLMSNDWQFIARRWDIGDHKALVPFLRNAYVKMEKFLGKSAMRRLYLTDLNIINLALPVVMNPMSNQWDRAEYRKHFVPLLSVVTYWGTYFGCRALIEWTFLSKVCNPAAGLARWWMTTSIGPKLADRVYKSFVRPTP